MIELKRFHPNEELEADLHSPLKVLSDASKVTEIGLKNDSSQLLSSKKNSKDNSERKFKCPFEFCNFAYRKNWLLQDHVRKHNNERPFVCPVDGCTKTFTKEAHLKRHKVMVHEKICEQICDVKGCGIVFNNKYSLKKHKHKVHDASYWSFYCSECSIGFKKKWQLNQHSYKHTGEPPFKCTVCNTGFTIMRDLTKHMRNHKTYTCTCGQIFERWSLLRSHRKNCAVKEKDIICNVCAKSFSTRHNLQMHLCSHEKSVETFRCPYMECTRNYKYKKNLNFHISVTHEKREQKEEDIPCSECGKIFVTKSKVARHIKRMHSKAQKVKVVRKERKDKGAPKTFTAATLAGVRLSQMEHKELLLNPEKILQVCLPKVKDVDTTQRKNDHIDHLVNIEEISKETVNECDNDLFNIMNLDIDILDEDGRSIKFESNHSSMVLNDENSRLEKQIIENLPLAVEEDAIV